MAPAFFRRSRVSPVPVRKCCDFLKVKRPIASLRSEWEIFRTPEVQMMCEYSTVPRLPNLDYWAAKYDFSDPHFRWRLCLRLPCTV